MAGLASRTRKRKRNSTSLQPCSTKRAGLISGEDNLGSAVALDEAKQGGGENGLVGIPMPIPGPSGHKGSATFVLEEVSLSLAYVGKRHRILSSNEHADYLRKNKLNPRNYRTDIVHEALRAILDSALNHEGMVGAIFVNTNSGVVFEVKPHSRIPRTCKRFCGLMDTGEVLFRVLEGSITQHIPENARIIGLSYSSEKVVDIEDYVLALADDLGVVFVVGTMVNGKVSRDAKDDYISVSEYPLGSKCCVGLVCELLEQKRNIC